MAEDEGFARRWSRLKQQARDERPPEEAPAPDLPATRAAQPSPEAADRPKEEPFDPATLPPVESLGKDSNYSLFMRPEVPEALRQKALRRLWATDAILSAPDPVDMHNIDYNAVPTFPDGFKSLAQVAEDVLGPEHPESRREAAEEPPHAADGDRVGTVSSETPTPDTHPPDAAAQQAETTKIKDSGRNNA